jgi:hypothetical protein
MPLEFYKNNDLSFDVSIYGISDLTGFVPYFTAKKNAYDTLKTIDTSGWIKDPSGTASFIIYNTDSSSITPGTFVCDVTLEKDGSIFTIMKDTLEVKKAVRY